MIVYYVMKFKRSMLNVLFDNRYNILQYNHFTIIQDKAKIIETSDHGFAYQQKQMRKKLKLEHKFLKKYSFKFYRSIAKRFVYEIRFKVILFMAKLANRICIKGFAPPLFESISRLYLLWEFILIMYLIANIIYIPI